MAYQLNIEKTKWGKFKVLCWEQGLTMAGKIESLIDQSLDPDVKAEEKTKAPAPVVRKADLKKGVWVTDADFKTDYFEDLLADARFEIEAWFKDLKARRAKEVITEPATGAKAVDPDTEFDVDSLI